MAIFEKPERIETTPASAGMTGAGKVQTEGNEKMFVMPQNFREGRVVFGDKKNFQPIFIILGIILLIALIGGSIYFFIQNSRLKTETFYESQNTNNLVKSNQPMVQNSAIDFVSKPQTVRTELKNESGQVNFWAELILPEGALLKDEIVDLVAETPGLGSSYNGYKVVAGFFKVTPLGLSFAKPVILKIYYRDEEVGKNWESKMEIAYFKNNILTTLKTLIDQENHNAILDLNFLPADTFALVIDEKQMLADSDTFVVSPQIPSSLDRDQDGLTDVEETLYTTDPVNPDTDGDGAPDGKEVLTLTDPLSKDNSGLALSGFIRVYSDLLYSYSFFYPLTWLARAVPDTDNSEIMITTNTNEFFTISLMENLDKLEVREWYQKQAGSDIASAEEKMINGQNVLLGPDGLTIYLKNNDKIFVFSYKLGLEKEANFKTTFRMILNSWKFILPEAKRADGSLIKYPSSSAIYLLENGEKRAFSDGQTFENLGYQWGQVVEIPDSEIFADGPIIVSGGTTTTLGASTTTSSY